VGEGRSRRRGSGTADLHTHSTVSDGTDTPAGLIAVAAAAGLDAVALTDHDTTEGWEEATEAARRTGIVFVPGMEMTCRVDGGSLHLLAYLPDSGHPRLVAELSRIRDDRGRRARSIVGRLAVDYELEWDDVASRAIGDTPVGRPHIADALVRRGHVADRDEAFRRLLAPGSPYYVDHYTPDAADAVRLVHEVGGVPVVAHPLATRRGGPLTDATIAALAEAGLAGLEADHRDHEPRSRDHLRGLAAELGLLVTGGSDYHGAGKPNAVGENVTAPAVLEAIEEAASGTLVIRP
jgi:predicted metal-dependent phosphoesterase TrpH